MGRKAAREIAMQLLYEWAMGGEAGSYSLDEAAQDKKMSPKDVIFIQDIRQGVEAHIEEINQIIQQYAIKWRIDRMAKVDLAILRLAIYEMLYRDDIPANVSMNEAVELAKLYSSPESPSFINGILSAFHRGSRPQQEVEKT